MKQLKLWKRNAIVGIIVLFVCGAVYLNWSYNNRDAETGKTLGEAALVAGKADEAKNGDAATTPEGSKTGNGYFSEARLNRQQARDSALALLRESAGDANASQETIEDANVAIQTMANYTLTEAQIENLVVAKGYTNCVAFLNDSSISVVVSGIENGITDADVAKIGEIVMEQTGLTADQIKIIETD